MIEYEVEIPKDVEVKIEGRLATVKGKLGELRNTFDFDSVKHERRGDKIILEQVSKRKGDRSLVGAIAAHLKNMIKGVTNGYEYRMKIVYAHFPINVSMEGNRFVIKNFAGEKTPRYAEVHGNAKVEIRGQEIIVTAVNKEDAGQTAANIERATKIRGKDLRVFQDGIYITSKGE